ncbi:MAG: MBL fold metallo-hydrolase [Chloroflexi bacterium]|nr:MBL fold metallo-hydrolase [Chloroflexota bacterium]
MILDVWEPNRFTRPPTADDVLLTTHVHMDHYISGVVKAFPGRKLTFETGQIVLPDVKITSIAAGHNEGDHLAAKDGTDYIFLIEIDGVRIADFGDLGQKRLSDDQMAQLGRVDVAISQLDNDMSGMAAVNHKGLNQMQQVGPMVFIPTAHISHETMQQAAAAFHSTFTLDPSITLTQADLPSATTMLVMGMQARFYGKFLALKPNDW